MFAFFLLFSAKKVIITDDNFVDVLKNQNNIFLQKINRWCNACKKFYPIWEELTKKKEFAKIVTFATVDCHDSPEICFSFEDKVTPSFYWYNSSKNSPIHYSGEYELEVMYNFIKRQLNSNLPLLSQTSFKNFQKIASKISFFYFNISKDDSDALALAHDVAMRTKHMGINIGYIESPNLSSSLNLYCSDDVTVEYKGKWTSDDIISWIHIHQIPFLRFIYPSNEIILRNNHLGAFLLLMPSKLTKSDDFLLKTSTLGHRVAEKASFMRLSCNSYKPLCNYLDVETPEEDIFLIYINSTNKTYYKYPYPLEFEEKDVETYSTWAEHVLNNSNAIIHSVHGPGIGHFRFFKRIYFSLLIYNRHIPLIILIAIATISALFIFFSHSKIKKSKVD